MFVLFWHLDDEPPVEGGGAGISSVGEPRVRLHPPVLRVAVVRHREPLRAELLLVLQT